MEALIPLKNLKKKIAGLFAQKFFSQKPEHAVEKAMEEAAEQERIRQLEL